MECSRKQSRKKLKICTHAWDRDKLQAGFLYEKELLRGILFLLSVPTQRQTLCQPALPIHNCRLLFAILSFLLSWIMHRTGACLNTPEHTAQPDTYKTGVHEFFAHKVSPQLLKWHVSYDAESKGRPKHLWWTESVHHTHKVHLFSGTVTQTSSQPITWQQQYIQACMIMIKTTC